MFYQLDAGLASTVGSLSVDPGVASSSPVRPHHFHLLRRIMK